MMVIDNLDAISFCKKERAEKLPVISVLGKSALYVIGHDVERPRVGDSVALERQLYWRTK
jgi:hypothetical protein